MQKKAYECEAHVIGCGGMPGGGKTDILWGVAWERHPSSIVFRNEMTQMENRIIPRGRQVLSGVGDYRGQPLREFNHAKGIIKLGALSHLGSYDRYQGGEWSGMFFDEATNMLEAEVKAVMTWNRDSQNQRLCQSYMFFNPPTDIEGEWIIEYFAPWLDKYHEDYPAKEGEIRWYVTIAGQSVEVPDGNPIMHEGLELHPRSRTFFRSRLEENPDLRDEYPSVLASLPFPMNQQMLHGDFDIGRDPNVWQVIPPDWVDQAMARSKQISQPTREMTRIGVDVARGGRAQTVLARRYGNYFAELIRIPGEVTEDGNDVLGFVRQYRENNCLVTVDVIGVGTAAFDIMRNAGVWCEAFNAAMASEALDKRNLLGFANLRADAFWAFREALEPGSGEDIVLPVDRDLKADLCVARYRNTPHGILIEAKEDIFERLGRSTDAADAVVLAWYRDRMRLPGSVGLGNVKMRVGRASK